MSEPALLKNSTRQRGNVRLLWFIDRLTYTSVIGGALAVIALLLLLLGVMAQGAAPAWQRTGSGFLSETQWNAHPPSPQKKIYRTKEGDTPQSIAKQFGFDAEHVLDRETLQPFKDSAGQLDEGTPVVIDPPPPQPTFGAMAFAIGTLATALIALVIALPISMGAAIFLTKLGPRNKIRDARTRTIARHVSAALISIGMTGFCLSALATMGATAAIRVVLLPGFLAAFYFLGRMAFDRFLVVIGFMIELLAAIPSIAYGLWGVAVLVPFSVGFLQPLISDTADLNFLGGVLPHWHVGLNLSHWPWIGQFFVDSHTGRNTFSAGLILSIMITPIMTAIIRDVLSAAPPELEQGALGLGATWWQATRLVLGYSKMGILGAVILGFARAIGETMAVTLIIGDTLSFYSEGPMKGHLDRSVFATSDSIASKLAVQFNNADTPAEIHALILMAFVLLLITTLINSVARVLIVRVAAKGGKR